MYEIFPKKFKLVDGYDLFKKEVEEFHLDRAEDNDDPILGVMDYDTEFTQYIYSRYDPKFCKTYYCFDIYDNNYKEYDNNKIAIIWNDHNILFGLTHDEFINKVYDYCIKNNVIITYNDGYNDESEDEREYECSEVDEDFNQSSSDEE